jgi:cytochrome P450
LPALIQTVGLFAFRRPYLNACRRRYGDVVELRTLFGPRFVVVFDPAIVGELLRAPPDHACAGAANAASEPLHGSSSLLLLDGAEHLRQRRLLSPPFHGQRMRAYERAMREAADRAIDSWPVGEPFALMPSMHGLTLEVIMRAVFGVGDDREGAALEREVRGMLETSAGSRFERHRSAVSELLRAAIARRRATPDLQERSDVLSALIAAAGEDDARALSDDELHDELVTLLVAGHETTANALGWALELIVSDDRVRARIDETLAADDHEYLDAVVKETLRLRPVVTGLGRLVCEAPLRVGAYEVPSGIEVTPSIETIHADPASYPDPAAFRPERFLNGGDPANAWLPYGGGIRRCLGAAFASFEMRIVLARVLERTRLRPFGRSWPRFRRGVTPPTRPAFARALRRGRRKLPARGARVIQVGPPDPA